MLVVRLTLYNPVFLFQWTFHPFILKSKKIYTVLLWCRVLALLVVSADSLQGKIIPTELFGVGETRKWPLIRMIAE